MSPSEHQLRHSPALRASVLDAIWFFVMFGAGEMYLSPFGIHLGGSSQELAVLVTLPLLVGAICQLLGVWLMGYVKSRRTLIVGAVVFQACIWPFIAAIPFVAPEKLAMTFLIAGATLYMAAGNLSAPVWNSLIGDLVPAEHRGKFFGFRNRRAGFALIGTVIGAGFFMQLARQEGFETEGFIALFAIAFLSRLRSAYWLTKYDDPIFEAKEEDRFSLWDFLRRMPHSNFAKFTFFSGALHFAVFTAAPFFSPYLFREVQVTYVDFMMLTVCQLIAQFLTMQHWGKIGDRFGNKRLITFSTLGLSLIPFVWLVSSTLWWLVIVHIISGFFWAGFSLSCFNFLMDAVTPPKRARCAAYMSLMNCLGVFLGGKFGAALLLWMERSAIDLPLHLDTPTSIILDVVLLSGILRLFVWVAFERLFKEVRTVEPTSHREFLAEITNVRYLGHLAFSVIGKRSRTTPPKPEER